MDCGYILYWVLFVCVLFGIVDIVMGMLFCNFCGPHCCCTAFCLAALFSLSSLVRLFLPCCGFSVFLGNGKMVSNFLLSKMKEWFSNIFSSSLSYIASAQWLIMVLSLQRSFIVLLDDTFFSCRHCCQTSSQTVMLPSVLGCLLDAIILTTLHNTSLSFFARQNWRIEKMESL